MKELTDIIINSVGAVAVATVAFIYIDRKDQRTNDVMSNHLDHNTKATTKLSKMVEHLSNLIKERLK